MLEKCQGRLDAKSNYDSKIWLGFYGVRYEGQSKFRTWMFYEFSAVLEDIIQEDWALLSLS